TASRSTPGTSSRRRSRTRVVSCGHTGTGRARPRTASPLKPRRRSAVSRSIARRKRASVADREAVGGTCRLRTGVLMWGRRSRSLGAEDEDHAEANTFGPRVRVARTAAGRAAALTVVIPRATADDAGCDRPIGLPGVGTFRIGRRALRGVVLLEPIAAPLPDVAMHIVQPPIIGLVLADRGRRADTGLPGGVVVRLRAVEVGVVGGDLRAVVRRGRGAGTTGVLPFGLRRQAIGTASLHLLGQSR